MHFDEQSLLLRKCSGEAFFVAQIPEAYKSLPETFGVKEVMNMLDLEKAAAHKQCQRWMMHGFVERVRQGKYRKIIKDVMI